MIDIRTNSNTTKSDPIPEHIYGMHQSMVEEKIITHPEIITCSQQWIKKEEKDIPNPSKSKRVKRCHYVNHCPICNFIRKQKVKSQMNPYRQTLLDNGGKNILVTLSLRHKNHPFQTLQKLLTGAVPKFKNSRTFKNKLFPSKHRLYTLTEYEISWSEEFGFNPHCHLMIGSTNPLPEGQIQSELSNEWRKTIERTTDNSNLIPSYAKGVDVSDNPSGAHSKDKDPYGLDAIKEMQKKSNKKMKERFRKKDSFSQFQMQYHLSEKTSSAQKFISILKVISKNIFKSFRSLFFNPNRHHPLFSEIPPF